MVSIGKIFYCVIRGREIEQNRKSNKEIKQKHDKTKIVKNCE